MKSLSYWQQFATTGKIEDYLKYASQIKQEEGAAKEEAGSLGAAKETDGENTGIQKDKTLG